MQNRQEAYTATFLIGLRNRAYNRLPSYQWDNACVKYEGKNSWSTTIIPVNIKA